MSLTVLSDADIRSLLHTLGHDDIVRLQRNLAEALHDYSTGAQDVPSCSANQPSRIQLCTKDSSTLFIPARTATTTGVKVLTLASPSADPASSTPSISGSATDGSTRSIVSGSTSSSALGGSTAATTASQASAQTTTPRGTLTLLRSSGSPLAFLGAAELTAFRTALASTLLFARRARVHTIAVLGAGKQAYWHVRLALLLRPGEVHHVRIINRSFAGAEPLLQAIHTDPAWSALREGEGARRGGKGVDFSVLSAEYGEYARVLKEQLREADAIFCCTPATAPLFPAEILTSAEGRRKGRFVGLVGSYRPHMLEVDPEVLRQAVAPEHGRHHRRHATRGGAVVVDSLEACLREAGEIIQGDLGAEQLVEVGELIMVKRAAMREVEMGGQGEEGLMNWLEAGNVIYKSVGLGLMDVCVGEDLVALAAERRIGVRLDDFS